MTNSVLKEKKKQFSKLPAEVLDKILEDAKAYKTFFTELVGVLTTANYNDKERVPAAVIILNKYKPEKKKGKVVLIEALVLNILQGGEDFSIIIVLDLWKNRNKTVIRSRSEAAQINKHIGKLAESLNGETYTGSRWLLLYETEMGQLIDKTLFIHPKKDEVFEELASANIVFYQSIKRISK